MRRTSDEAVKGITMSLLPITRMVDRIEVERTDSDFALSNALMYAGEMLTKLVVAGLVAAIEDDSEKHTPPQSFAATLD